ncbi:MAG: hypothetical protein DRH93_20055 [Deltaproteobacteria bacterium]|nr:MAG: hypothetical protein DRH93_20055 [Deltaproteobacteria bacterium]
MKHHIKKYANRKLYDNTEKRYVSMDDIAGFIKSDEEIIIIDNVTNKDITHEVVSQLVGREFDGQARKLPLPILSQLLRKGSGGIVDYSRKYLSFWQGALSYANDGLGKIDSFVRDDQNSAKSGEKFEEDSESPQDKEMEKLLNNRIDQRLETMINRKDQVSVEQFSQLQQSITRLETNMETVKKMFIQLLEQDKKNSIK